MPILKNNIVSRRTLLKAGAWFSLFNALFILVLSFRYLSLIPDELFSTNCFYLFSLVISHFVFLSCIPFFFLYVPLTILTKNKSKSMIAAAVGATLLLIILLIDSYVFSLYRFHINSYVIEQLFGPGASQVFELALVQYFLAVVLLLGLVVAEIFLFRFSYWLATKSRILYLYIVGAFLFFFGAVCQLTHAYGEANGNRLITGLDKYFPLCTPLNANKLLTTVGIPVKEDVIVTDFQDKKYCYPKKNLKTTATEKNVLIIALDSWHYRTLDSLVAPNLYKFSKKSSLFTHHYSGSNGTRTGVFSLFFGLPGVYWDDFCKQNISPVFMDELQKRNYDVRLFPSASLLNPTLDKNVFMTVPDQCVAADGVNGWQRDKNLTDKFLSFLDSQDSTSGPFFSFLFYDSLHSMIIPDGYKGPFQPSWTYPKYEMLGKDVDPTEFFNLYKNMVRYLDNIFGKLIHELEIKGLLENTVIIVTGDHGQEFDDNKKNFWGHNGNYSDAQVCVPMIYYSNERLPKIYNHWTAHYDIMPTLMQDVFLTENPVEDYSVGKSLFDESKRDFLIVDSYIGLGVIDTSGRITTVYYDGKYEILDKHLNELHDVKFDSKLYKKALSQISSFYVN